MHWRWSCCQELTDADARSVFGKLSRDFLQLIRADVDRWVLLEDGVSQVDESAGGHLDSPVVLPYGAVPGWCHVELVGAERATMVHS